MRIALIILLLTAAAPLAAETLGPAPDFDVTTLEGKSLSLSELRGQTVVLNFWFAGCPPCITEMPALNRLVKRFANDPVVFVAFSKDKSEILRKFRYADEFHYQLVGDDREVHHRYGVSGYPTHVLIDRDGEVREVVRGGAKNIDRALARMIEQLLD